jgi:hypothetical protein
MILLKGSEQQEFINPQLRGQTQLHTVIKFADDITVVGRPDHRSLGQQPLPQCENDKGADRGL